jgi:hypothetical protein
LGFRVLGSSGFVGFLSFFGMVWLFLYILHVYLGAPYALLIYFYYLSIYIYIYLSHVQVDAKSICCICHPIQFVTVYLNCIV